MKHFILLIIATITLILLPVKASVADDKQLPAMRYVSNVDDEFSFDLIKENTYWTNLQKELHGSPFVLIAFMETRATNGGTAAATTTGLLSATTLGLIPVVNNSDVVVTFRIRLNNWTVTEHVYTHNFTDASSLWTAGQNKLSKDAKAWLKTATQQFLADVTKDDKLNQVIKEYDYYFGDV